MKYLVTAEIIATHTVIVVAQDEDEASEKYLDGEWEEDRGETLDDDSAMVLSVEEINDES